MNLHRLEKHEFQPDYASENNQRWTTPVLWCCLKKPNQKSIRQRWREGFDSTPALIQEHHHKAAALNQSHQFAINEEVLALSSFTTGIAGLGSKRVPMNRVRRGLSLAEWQNTKSKKLPVLYEITIYSMINFVVGCCCEAEL